MKPTKEQEQEFWKRCGFTRDSDGWWMVPDKSYQMSCMNLDLNNLFKLAVPKAIEEIMPELGMDYDDALHSLIHDWMKLMRGKKDPALALFWAIKEVQLSNSTKNI